MVSAKCLSLSVPHALMLIEVHRQSWSYITILRGNPLPRIYLKVAISLQKTTDPINSLPLRKGPYPRLPSLHRGGQAPPPLQLEEGNKPSLHLLIEEPKKPTPSSLVPGGVYSHASFQVPEGGQANAFLPFRRGSRS